MTPHALRVFDNVVADPVAYRAAALAQSFGDFHSGIVVFHGLAPIGRSEVARWLETRYGLQTTYETFRRSPHKQVEPTFVHTDRDMGDWSLILYLNPDPPPGDGTTFWRARDTGAIASVAATPDERIAEALTWRDVDRWEPWQTVPATLNRAVLFPAPYFHSRALFDNYGEADSARLIQLCFGTGALCV